MHVNKQIGNNENCTKISYLIIIIDLFYIYILRLLVLFYITLFFVIE